MRKTILIAVALLVAIGGVIVVSSFEETAASKGETEQMDGKYRRLRSISETVVFGVIEEQLSVIRPEKLQPKTEAVGGATDSNIINQKTLVLSKPADYQVGRLFKIRVSEVLSGKAKKQKDKEKEFLYVFQSGYLPAHDDPALVAGKSYVFFLKPLEPNQAFENTKIFNFEKQGEAARIFDPQSSYTLTKHELSVGAFEVKPKDVWLLKEIKKAM